MNNNMLKICKNKRVIITGHKGFGDIWLCL